MTVILRLMDIVAMVCLSELALGWIFLLLESVKAVIKYYYCMSLLIGYVIQNLQVCLLQCIFVLVHGAPQKAF